MRCCYDKVRHVILVLGARRRLKLAAYSRHKASGPNRVPPPSLLARSNFKLGVFTWYWTTSFRRTTQNVPVRVCQA
eukprot:2805256-Rhodomonas_salina.1